MLHNLLTLTRLWGKNQREMCACMGGWVWMWMWWTIAYLNLFVTELSTQLCNLRKTVGFRHLSFYINWDYRHQLVAAVIFTGAEGVSSNSYKSYLSKSINQHHTFILTLNKYLCCLIQPSFCARTEWSHVSCPSLFDIHYAQHCRYSISENSYRLYKNICGCLPHTFTLWLFEWTTSPSVTLLLFAIKINKWNFILFSVLTCCVPAHTCHCH